MKIVTKNYAISKGDRSYLIYLVDHKGNSLECFDIVGEKERLNKENELINIRKLSKVKAQNIVYFGDQKNDYITSKSAGIGFIGINAGSNLDTIECKKFLDFEKLIAYEIAGRL